MSQSLNYYGRTAAAGKKVRQYLTRENFVAFFKTLAWLVPLTLLIWIYAERAQVVPVDNVSIPIDVQSADPNRFVALEMTDKNVIARMSGPLSRIDDLRQRINPEGGKPTVLISIDPSIGKGEISLDSAPQIANSRIFKYSGVNIYDARPARLKVRIDDYVEHEIPVVAPADVTNLTNPVFTPAKITVRAPSSYFPTNVKLVAEADLAGAKILDKPGHYEVTVHVVCPVLPTDNVTYTPSVVKAVLDVNPTDVKYTLKSVPVYLQGPNFVLTQRDVKYQDTVYDVKVVGPPDKIAQLESQDVKPIAVLKIDGKDLSGPSPASPKTRRLDFEGFPDGVRLDTGVYFDWQFSLVDKATQQ